MKSKMRKALKVNTLGAALITALIALAFTACTDDNGSDSGSSVNPPLIDAGFTISFNLENHTPLVDSGITLSLLSSASPITALITVANAGNYNTITWLQNDKELGTGAAYTLHAQSGENNWLGTHFVTVRVVKDGMTYNTTVSFNVVF